jgi:hypothetical protein
LDQRLSRVSRRASEEAAGWLNVQVDAFPKRDHVAWRVNPVFSGIGRHEPVRPVLGEVGDVALLVGHKPLLIFSVAMSDAEICIMIFPIEAKFGHQLID